MKCKAKADQYTQLDKVIEQTKNMPGPIIQTLHSAQKVFGFLPREVMEYVADKLGKPRSEVYGVATFYHLFHLTPKGHFQLKVCLGTACYIRGGQSIIDVIRAELGIGIGDVTEDGAFSLEVVRCIGACGLAPAMMVNDAVYDRLISASKTRAIVAKYRALAVEAMKQTA